MKTKLLFTTVLTLIISINLLISQTRTDYSKVFIEGPGWNFQNSSSTYWYGHTYIFSDYTGMSSSSLSVSWYEMQNNGNLNYIYKYYLVDNLPYAFNVTSCAYNRNLYGFYWYQGDNPEIKYVEKKIDQEWTTDHSIDINETIVEQMSALTYNDTIYMFFIDDADKLAKYHRIVYSEEQTKLVLVSETPVLVYGQNTSIGNIAAITYVNNDEEEKIMLAYPGAYKDRDNNEINIYTGTPANFDLYAQHPCATNHSSWSIAMAQGSIEGGATKAYNIQFGYTHDNSGSGLERCELNLNTNEFSDWESIDYNGYIMGKATWFSEFYSKSSNKRQKYLLQGYNRGDGAGGALWKSDILEYQDQRSDVPPESFKSKFFDVILVVEGAPPYALNGYDLGDDLFGNNPLSIFEFTKETELSVSASTTYTQSVEANMGVGPVTAGFKASFMQSHGTSNTESITITNTIVPPLSQLDSNGLMWYYYIAPTVVRSRWALQDYNGDEIEPSRNLFFFNFESPQLKTMTYDLSFFDDNSPRAYDLHKYENRGVENMSGMYKILRTETDVNIKQGGTGSLELTFGESQTDSYSKSYEVSLGTQVDVGIFNASASASAGFEYGRERTTTCSNSFYVGWNLFPPKVPEDENNIRKYTAISYVMKTEDNSAYYLLDDLNDYTPYFITYEVQNIEHGDFIFAINENEAVEKYKFFNYPNPCADRTNFKYVLPNRSYINLTVYNSFGQIIKTPFNEMQNVGNHQLDFKTANLPKGIYYYRLQIDNDIISGKIIKN